MQDLTNAEDDFLPKRFTEEPATGNSAGDVSRMDIMLKEYYEVRGWKDGVVPEEKLRELEIILNRNINLSKKGFLSSRTETLFIFTESHSF